MIYKTGTDTQLCQNSVFANVLKAPTLPSEISHQTEALKRWDCVRAARVSSVPD
jgi:hypothetical protein